MEYIVNIRSRRLHKLPAPESCNTDQIEDGEKFVDEEPVRLIRHYDGGWEYAPVIRCKRCFKVPNHTHPIAHDSMYEHDGYGHHSHPPS